MTDTKNRSESEKDELEREASRACGERLAGATDLSAFNTVEKR